MIQVIFLVSNTVSLRHHHTYFSAALVSIHSPGRHQEMAGLFPVANVSPEQSIFPFPLPPIISLSEILLDLSHERSHCLFQHFMTRDLNTPVNFRQNWKEPPGTEQREQ